MTHALDELGIRYYVCGSLASIVHGLMRTTLDADMVAELTTQHVGRFVQALNDEFFIDADAVGAAVRGGSSFNILHQATMFKVDVFPARGAPFDQVQFDRRQRVVFAENPERLAYVASAEDTLLAKLVWFRKGNEVSERQWRDVLGIIKTQSDRLDQEYLQRWAVELRVDDLLERAIDAENS